MTTISTRTLADELAAHLRAVRDGETLIVTEEGRAIAEIRPVAPPGSDDLSRRLEDLAARGLVSGNLSGRPNPRRVQEPLALPGVDLTEAILEDREDRF